jgi:signal recognition particle receptor subunit beta
VICGPAGSGKTQLFLKLVGGQVVSTVDSAACNFGNTRHGRKVVDVPGSAKLRRDLFDEALPTARCVILLLNGAKLETLHNDIGFVLHVVAKCMKRKCPILLLVGKDDLAGEMALAKITSSLDDELQRLAKQYTESEADADNDDPIRSDVLSILKKLDLEEDPTLLSIAAIASRFNLHSLTHNKSNPVDRIVNWMDNKV